MKNKLYKMTDEEKEDLRSIFVVMFCPILDTLAKRRNNNKI